MAVTAVDPRYPIGEFSLPDSTTPAQRQAQIQTWIREIASAPPMRAESSHRDCRPSRIDTVRDATATWTLT